MESQGESVAEGEFTIAGRDALRKLREHQLESRGVFACHFVAAVVNAGGAYLQYAVTQHGLRFMFDQPRPNQSDLELLFNAPFNSIAPQWQKELATAINGALGLAPLILKLETWDHERKQGYTWQISDDSEQLEVLASPWLAGVQGTRVTVVLRPPNARGFNMARFSKPVRSELGARCSMAPVDIRMRGRNQGKGFAFSGKPIAHEMWSCTDPSLAHFLTELEPRKSGVWREHQHDEPFSAYLALEARKEPEVTFVVNGVAHALPKGQEIKVPLLRAVITAPYLKKDLSQSKLRNDRSMQSLIQWVNQKSMELLLHTCATFWPLRGRSLLLFNRAVTSIYGEDEQDHPTPIADWFEHCDLLAQTEDETLFCAVLKQSSELEEKRRRSIHGRLDTTQQLRLKSALVEADWATINSALDNIETLSLQRSSEFWEAFVALSSLIPGREKREYLDHPSESDFPDFRLRRALIHFLSGETEQAEASLSQAGGIWRLYLSAMLSKDPAETREHLEGAFRQRPEASFLLIDLADACYHNKDWEDGLEFRSSYLSRRPRAFHLWSRLRATESTRHGSFAQWVSSTAAASMADFSATGWRSESALLMKRLEKHKKRDWVELLESLESESQSAGRTRFLFSRGFWQLKTDGHHDLANKFLWRRLLRASLSESNPLSLKIVDFTTL